MIDKKVLILETIIKEYIKNPTPVSSKHLQSKLNIKISSATIRNYFKKMVEEGELEQLHISSGRIPAIKTLKNYWKNVLKDKKDLKIENSSNIKESTKKFNIFCEYKFYEPNRLKSVINFKDRFIILEFENSEFIIEYNEPIYRFFKEFLGNEVSDLVKICRQIGLTTLSKKLNAVSNEDIISEGIEELLDIVAKNREWGNKNIKAILDGIILDDLKPGIYFEEVVPTGYLAYNTNAQIEKKDAKMLCIGHLSRDYEKFFNNLTKE
ncbi:HrcA family transcriptional regulator [Nitrosophilus kaiyonis]|uniref:HrcA family transcriptional regulator n=1 Tax=Nitrosophilus kaiyonis TaxID=2930200 RepID=UPI0024933BD8|nr:HrcA family transcriptional regulator [Nitrosophilus kaiyonis]